MTTNGDIIKKMETERIAKLEIQVEAIKEDVAELKVDVKEIHSRITTGNREIVEKMDDMQTRIEHKMNAQAEVQKTQHDAIQNEIREDVEKLGDRVSKLEQWKWYVIGGAATIGYLIGHIQDIAKFLK